jgi:hypothetical protein
LDIRFNSYDFLIGKSLHSTPYVARADLGVSAVSAAASDVKMATGKIRADTWITNPHPQE